MITMAKTYENKAHKGEEPRFEKTPEDIAREVPIGGAIEVLSAAEFLTRQQVRWWKGVLLPSLSEHTGDSKGYWETKLKLAVLPDEFQPEYIPIGKQVFPIVPTVKVLSKTKMNELIKGSVAHLRENPEYGDEFQWVTEPDSELRKDQ